MLLTQDLAKYIFGFDIDSTPSSFQNYSDYIIHGVPEDKLKFIVSSSLLISVLVPKLGDFTALVVANFFGDGKFAKEIKSQINKDY